MSPYLLWKKEVHRFEERLEDIEICSADGFAVQFYNCTILFLAHLISRRQALIMKWRCHHSYTNQDIGSHNPELAPYIRLNNLETITCLICNVNHHESNSDSGMAFELRALCVHSILWAANPHPTKCINALCSHSYRLETQNPETFRPNCILKHRT